MSRPVGYVAAVLSGGFVRTLMCGDGSAWFGFDWLKFGAGLLVNCLMITIFALPLYVISFLLSDKFRTRNVLLYCSFGMISGALWLLVSILVLGTDNGDPLRETYTNALSSVIGPGIVGGFVQWLVSEKGKSSY